MAVLLAKCLPGIGSPLQLTLRQFSGITNALADDSSKAVSHGNNREAVEAQMRKLHGSR